MLFVQQSHNKIDKEKKSALSSIIGIKKGSSPQTNDMFSQNTFFEEKNQTAF
jgi:hypothetical protein